MINGEILFAGRRGAEQQAEFWEREVLRMQLEEFDIATS
jgi:E3 ubiquitin-protein ligase RNF14